MEKPKGASIREDLAKSITNLTTNITYIVLISFIIILASMLIKAMVDYNLAENTETGEVWLSLFKDGFLLLGGVFTTLIGYYFGSKGSDVVIDQYKQVSTQKQKLEGENKQLAENKDELQKNLDRISPTTEADADDVEAFPI